jgi:hypothetical protein
MPQRWFVLFIVTVFFLCSGSRWAVDGQTRPQRSPGTAVPPVSQKDDKWWAAQRSIEAAIQQVESYLREAPNGSHAPAARQQLAVLRSLTITRSQPEWVVMRALPLPEVPMWRVVGVDQLPDRTRALIEVRCGRDDGGDCNFRRFDPLVLVDTGGELYPMIEAHALSRDIRLARDGQVLLAAGRTLSITVDFAPLSASASGGQIQYRDANEAQPAKFSLIRKP